MRFEIPLFKRCCFCVPLRYGLLVWAYLSLMPMVLYLVFISVFFAYFAIRRRDFEDITCSTLLIILLLTNMTSNFFLIVAAHKKSVKLMNIYKKYALGLALANFWTLLVYLMFAFEQFNYNWYYYWLYVIIEPLIYLIYIGMQLYIIAMVRSEILKLESNQKFEFCNLAAEAEKAHYEPETIKIEDQHALYTEIK